MRRKIHSYIWFYSKFYRAVSQCHIYASMYTSCSCHNTKNSLNLVQPFSMCLHADKTGERGGGGIAEPHTDADGKMEHCMHEEGGLEVYWIDSGYLEDVKHLLMKCDAWHWEREELVEEMRVVELAWWRREREVTGVVWILDICMVCRNGPIEFDWLIDILFYKYICITV